MGFHALLYSAAFMIPAAIGFITFSALTHFLTPFEYGVYSTAVNLGNFAASVFFAWIRFSAARFEAEGRGGIALSFWTRCYASMLPIAAVAMAVAYLLGAASLEVMLGVFALSACQGLFDLVQEFHRAHREAQRFAAYNLLRATISIALAIPIGYFFHTGTVQILALSLSFLVVAVLNLVRLKQTPSKIEARRYDLKSIAGYGVGLAASGLVFSSIGVISRLMVVHMVGLSSAGPYNASLDLAGQIGGIVAMSISSVTSPAIIRAFADGDLERVKANFRRGAELLLAAVCPTTVGLMIVARPLADLLTGAAFHETIAQLLPWVVVSVAIWNVNHHYIHIVFQITAKPLLQVTAGAIQVLLLVGLSYLFIGAHGVLGAAQAMVVANVLTMMVTIILARGVFPIPFPPMVLVKVSVCTAVMAAIAVLAGSEVSSLIGKLVVQSLSGGIAYGLIAIALDLCGSRQALSKLVSSRLPSSVRSRLMGR